MKTLLRSDDLSCPSCIAKIEKRLTGLPGVEFAKVHFNTGKIEVRHNEEQTDQETLIATVRDTGYESRVAKI
tara:strand:+ start:966 stop:1181 length:216 start_codon:yes stop_codon:yes gene_type:complete